ncbi:MAG: tRNA pseudouridine(38-40) synthase TruA [Methanobacteriaceae archaeon]|jgi:tRNA pseudouridine38-40 synthase|nr:tRNA pseudouridine(38-40) synthase TruA [Methanobacteriaceae archaeon]
MKRTALKIGYIGTNFHGFQRQPNIRTVEEELIYHLKKLGYIDDLKESRFRIAGRTDTGVHSLGNVISFQSEKEVLVNQINNSLPDDIQILAKAPVRFGFKPRFAKMRHYRYILLQEGLDIDLIKEVADLFIGTHNFTNFTKRYQKTTTRTITDIKVSKVKISKENKDNLPHLNNSYYPIFVDIYGESFLWNMVRKMMRVFIDVNLGNISINDVKKYLNPQKNTPREHIKVLEGEYLILMNIEYDGINFTYDDYAYRRFKKYLLGNLLDFQKDYAITECFLKSLNDVNKK